MTTNTRSQRENHQEPEYSIWGRGKKIPTIPYPFVALGSQSSPHIILDCEICVRRDGSKDRAHIFWN